MSYTTVTILSPFHPENHNMVLMLLVRGCCILHFPTFSSTFLAHCNIISYYFAGHALICTMYIVIIFYMTCIYIYIYYYYLLYYYTTYLPRDGGRRRRRGYGPVNDRKTRTYIVIISLYYYITLQV